MTGTDKLIMKKIVIYLLCLLIFFSGAQSLCAQAKTSKSNKTTKSSVYIRVNRIENTVTVYDKATKLPIRGFSCSAGEMNRTPMGSGFKTTQYYKWRNMVDGSYAQYAIRFNNHIMFHSVPYYKQDRAKLEKEEFNKLGSKASLGCIRLCVNDVKWIYEHCPAGTKVDVYDDASSPGPFGKPRTVKMNVDDPRAGWDPTDSDSSNPWLRVMHSVSVRNADGNLTLEKGQSIGGIKKQLKVLNASGQEISEDKYSLEIQGIYNVNIPGKYEIWVKTWNENTGLFTDSSYNLIIK